MKIKSLLLMFTTLLLAGLVTGCEDPIVEPTFDKNLILAQESVELDPNAELTVDIVDGNGGYTVSSTDEDVAVGFIADGKVGVRGVGGGRAVITVKDANGVQAALAVLTYMDLETEVNTASFVGGDSQIGIPSQSVTITITRGNGGYSLSSDNPDIEAVIGEDINGKEAVVISTLNPVDNGTVTLRDRTGRSVQITVDASAPFDTEAFMNNSTNRYRFNGTNTSSYWTSNNRIENNMYCYDTSYYSWSYFECRWPVSQGINVGPKTGATFRYSSGVTSTQPVNLSVVKNDGSKVWIIFTHNGRIGEVVQPVL